MYDIKENNTPQELQNWYREKQQELIHSHFKYNKLGFVVTNICDLSKDNLEYAYEILEKVKNGVTKEELMDDLYLVQTQSTNKLHKEMEEIKNSLSSF